MDTQNLAFLNYDTSTEHSWSNVGGFSKLKVVNVEQSGNIKKNIKKWNVLPELKITK